MPVARFCRRLGIPRSTWYCWRDAQLAGRPHRRWPAPVVDAIEEPAAEQAHRFSAWGQRKIWAMLRADGVRVSQSSVYRGLKRRNLLQPGNYHAERRALAQARKAAFVAPPGRRNRVWQMDFTRFEITNGQVWWLCPVTDYHAKVCLGAWASTTTAARDAVAALRVAIEGAEDLLGNSLLRDCIDPETGELTPIIVVTDNGPAFKSASFDAFIAGRPELRHVRTRHHAPETNGVVERFNQSLKYEHLYRLEIPNGQALVDEVEGYRDLYNRIRPHEALGFGTPLETYLSPPIYDVFPGSSVQES